MSADSAMTVRQMADGLSDDTADRLLRVLYRVGAEHRDALPAVADFFLDLSADPAAEVDRRRQAFADLADSIDEDGPLGAILGPVLDDGEV